MAQRITLPAGHNHTTEHHPRMLHCNRLCDEETAKAIFKEVDVLNYGAWWWAGMVILAVASAVVIAVTA